MKHIGYKWTPPVYVSCHEGNVFCFEDKASGVNVYGGGATREAYPTKEMLVLDLCGRFRPEIEANFPLPACLESHKWLRISWEDMGTPSLSLDSWEQIIKIIRAEKRDVLVACQGGHGRTGTALSILAGLMGALPKEDIVNTLRGIYCEKIVETCGQIKYIEEMLGVDLLEKTEICRVTYGVGGVAGKNSDDLNAFYGYGIY